MNPDSNTDFPGTTGTGPDEKQPEPALMKIGAVINSASGALSPQETRTLLEEIQHHLEARVSPGCMAVVSAARIEEEVKRQKDLGIDVLVVGGGDGTVSTAARLVADTPIRLAVIGLGTRNNFARDLGIPLKPEEAIRLLDRMQVEDIDLGEVNGHKFINNATLGLYPTIVEKREETMQRRGWKKWPAHLAAALMVLWWLPHMKLAVKNDKYGSYRLTPIVFVGNNEYRGRTISDSTRPSLADGKLWFCMARASGMGSLLRMAWQLGFRGFQGVENLETHLVTSVTVYFRRRSVKVAIDGENYRLATPLRFRIHRKSLRVVVP